MQPGLRKTRNMPHGPRAGGQASTGTQPQTIDTPFGEKFNMKTIMKAFFVASLLAFASVASAADPVIGTWQLNLAKSKFSPGRGAESETRTYAAGADGITMTWKSVGANGKETSVTSTFKTDGKDYPVTGSPNFDTLSLKQVDSNTVHSMQKKGGKIIGETIAASRRTARR